MRKTIVFWLAFGFAVLAAVYLIVRVSMTMTGAGAGPHVSGISIDGGAGPLSARDISAAINLAGGQPVHSTDTRQMFDDVSAISAVRAASVRKIPSGQIAVRVRQRDIIAVWTDGTRFYPLAADGRKLDSALTAAPAGAVVFSGKLIA